MRKNLLRFFAAFVSAALPAAAYAVFNASPDQISICNTVEGLSCDPDLNATIGKLVDYANTAAMGILAGSIILYGMRLLFGADTDNTATETKQAFE